MWWDSSFLEDARYLALNFALWLDRFIVSQGSPVLGMAPDGRGSLPRRESMMEVTPPPNRNEVSLPAADFA